MKMVVDIPEDAYRQIRNWEVPTDELRRKIYDIIDNGTPLPKGHGDLVDFNRLCEEYWDGNYMEIHKDDLPNIKPIIEADRR